MSMSKKKLDETIQRIESLKGERDKAIKEIALLEKEVDKEFKLPDSEKETIYGNTYYVEKTPVNNGKNKYDPEKLHAIFGRARFLKTVIHKVELVDVPAINTLLKEKKIDEDKLSQCREDKWTYKKAYKLAVKNSNISQNLLKKAV